MPGASAVRAAANRAAATAVPTAPPPTRQQPTPTLAPNPAIRFALDLDPDTLDPAGQTTATVESIVDYMAETLVDLQPDGKICPAWPRSGTSRPTAASIPSSCAPTSTSTTARCSPPKWSRASLERFLNPKLRVALRAPFDNTLVVGIMPTDPLTVKIYLRESSRLFLQKLASTELAIVSAQHARDFPDSFNEEPIGTGPYRFKERRKGESVVLERFENYWGKLPHYPLVQFRIVPEVATRESLLLAGQVDLVIQPPLSDLPAFQKNPDLKVLLQPTSRTMFVAMDLTLPGGTPLSIKKVRQALNFAIDRDTIIRNVLFGAATPMDSPLAPALAGYSRTGPYGFDPGRAKSLLLEGGTPRLQLRLMHPTGRGMQDAQAAQVAQALAGNLHDVGRRLRPGRLGLAVVSGGDLGARRQGRGAHAPVRLGAGVSRRLAADDAVREGAVAAAGLATAHYFNARVETLVEQAAQERDDQRRSDAYAEAQRLVWDDAPWIFLWVPSFPVVHSARITGVGALPTEKLNAVYAEPT